LWIKPDAPGALPAASPIGIWTVIRKISKKPLSPTILLGRGNGFSETLQRIVHIPAGGYHSGGGQAPKSVIKSYQIVRKRISAEPHQSYFLILWQIHDFFTAD
jgi:hypothetical protein